VPPAGARGPERAYRFHLTVPASAPLSSRLLSATRWPTCRNGWVSRRRMRRRVPVHRPIHRRKHFASGITLSGYGRALFRFGRGPEIDLNTQCSSLIDIAHNALVKLIAAARPLSNLATRSKGTPLGRPCPKPRSLDREHAEPRAQRAPARPLVKASRVLRAAGISSCQMPAETASLRPSLWYGLPRACAANARGMCPLD
jgi:hypothetical protein